VKGTVLDFLRESSEFLKDKEKFTSNRRAIEKVQCDMAKIQRKEKIESMMRCHISLQTRMQ